MDYRENGEVGEPFLPEEVVQIRQEAEASYRGPVWIRWAVAATLFFCVGTIGFGLVNPVASKHPKPSATPIHPSASTDTIDTGSLPVTLRASYPFQLANLPTHVSVDGDKIYLASLKQAVNEWPTIDISAASFADSGGTLDKVFHRAGKVELVPPIGGEVGSKTTDTVNWSVHHWRIWAMKSWIVADVQWENPGNGFLQDQLYALYLPSGKYALVRTMPQTKTTSAYQVTAGDGRVVIARPIKAPNDLAKGQTKGAAYLVEINLIGGTDPLQPFTETHDVQLHQDMRNLEIQNNFLVFQSKGQAKPGQGVVDWFRMTWVGVLDPLTGLRSVFTSTRAVVGSSGDIYVAGITVPGQTSPGFLSMSPLTVGDQSPSSVSMLSAAPVQSLWVENGALVWIQTMKHRGTLVVGSVN